MTIIEVTAGTRNIGLKKHFQGSCDKPRKNDANTKKIVAIPKKCST